MRLAMRNGYQRKPGSHIGYHLRANGNMPAGREPLLVFATGIP